MALQKQPVNIYFAQGLDQKTDPKQVQLGKFLALENSVFTKGGLLSKRNGYGQLATVTDATFTTTFHGNLTAIGSTITAYSSGSGTTVTRGTIQPALVDTLSLIRSNTNQIQCDSAVSTNGLVCTVFTDNVPSGGSNVATYKYAIANVETGQNIVAPTVITVSSGTVTGSPRVFFLGRYFLIVITNNVSGTYHLQHLAINTNSPSSISTETDISTQYTPATTVAFDGFVANNNLYVAWNGNDGGGAIRLTYIDQTLTQHNTITVTGHSATMISVTADTTASTAVVWVSFYNLGTTTGYVFAVTAGLATVLAQTQIISSGTILNIASTAQSGVLSAFYEVSNAYSYDGSIKTNYIASKTVTQAGVVSSQATTARSVGLASKAFLVGGTTYFLAAYSSPYQPTFFLLNGSGQIVAKLAYSNGGGYLTLGLPSVSITDSVAQFAYLLKDFIASVSKNNGVSNGSSIYSQTGINLGSVTIGTSDISVSEIGANLNISGGILWAYDGYLPVEQGFHLWPDSVKATGSTTGGTMTAQQYYYQWVYEWTDNQGNIFRSAPSIPVTVTTTGATSSVTLNIPTLRLTYKTANPVKIVGYRWSTGQQAYYQITSISLPTLNDTTVDSVSFVDTLPDSSILGNSLLYTTGGVVENIGPPATSSTTIYKSRAMLVDAEDKNLVWFSKQIVESAPVEFSDLFTMFVPPTNSAQGPLGEITAISAMDDKFVIFNEDAIQYVLGNGPDNTGSNNDFSEPIFITGTVGCTNQQSIVLTPAGLMFQSKKGIWLLGRDLSTQYIGAPVEDFNSYSVLSAVTIPGTNQVRFVMSNGYTLMYDYYFGQWGTFKGVAAISSTIYQERHTFLNSAGQIYQETPGSYLDGANPVLMSFKTSWINLAGIQGYQRAYWLYLVGSYISPHKLSVYVAYDYAPNPEQLSVVTPDNQNPLYGGDPIYGSGTYGGTPTLEQWQVFFQRQRCESFQIQLVESFDSSAGFPAGAGLTLSNLNLTVGLKSGSPKLKAAASVG